ncbi:MAG: tetratricopeptide repeat protein, partial [Elusimicrobiota bacterium]
DNLKKSIEKSSKVLEQYPTKSKYLDQALLLLGKAFYFKGEYSKATRKFTELVNNYSKSRLYWEASFYLGMSLYQRERLDAAQKAFETLIKEDTRGTEWGLKGKYMLAHIAIEKENQEIALELFNKYSEFTRDKYLSNLIFYKIAVIEEERKNYKKAIENYRKVTYVRVPEKYTVISVEPEMEYRAQFAIGECLRKERSLTTALAHYRNMMNRDEYYSHFRKIKLEIGYCIMELDSIEKAVSVFQGIALEAPISQEAGEAYFNLGRIQEKKYGNLEKAFEYYEKSVKAFGASENARLAKARVDAIQKIWALRGKKMQAKSDTLKQEKKEEKTDSAYLKIGYAQRHYVTAEIFLFELEIIDSALMELDSIVSDTLFDSIYTPKAFYAKAWIMENFKKDQKNTADSIYRYIIKTFPNVKYAQSAQEALGMEVTIMTREDSALKALHEAEAYFDNPEYAKTAIEKYRIVADSFPDTYFAKQAILAMAWLYNEILFDLDSAISAYTRLKAMTKDNEESLFFKMAFMKLEGVKHGLDDLYKKAQEKDVGAISGGGPDIIAADLSLKSGPPFSATERDKATVMEDIQIAIRNELMPLYLEILKEKKDLKGEISITMSVANSGRVNYSDVDYNIFNNDEIEVALEEILDQIEFKGIENPDDQVFHFNLIFYNNSERPSRQKKKSIGKFKKDLDEMDENHK